MGTSPVAEPASSSVKRWDMGRERRPFFSSARDKKPELSFALKRDKGGWS